MLEFVRPIQEVLLVGSVKTFNEVVDSTRTPSCYVILGEYLHANGTLIWDFLLICLMTIAFAEIIKIVSFQNIKL